MRIMNKKRKITNEKSLMSQLIILDNYGFKVCELMTLHFWDIFEWGSLRILLILRIHVGHGNLIRLQHKM